MAGISCSWPGGATGSRRSLSGVKAAHGVSAVVLDVDLANAVQLEALCAEAADLPLGMLVNNAALAHYKPVRGAARRAGPGARPAQRARARDAHASRPPGHGRARRRRRDQRGLAARLQRSLGQALPAEARGLRGQQVVPRHLQRRSSPASCATAACACRSSAPGVVRSEFHTRQGMDMSEVPRMEAATLVAGQPRRSRARCRGLDPRGPGRRAAARPRRRGGGAGSVHARGRAARALHVLTRRVVSAQTASRPKCALLARWMI